MLRRQRLFRGIECLLHARVMGILAECQVLKIVKRTFSETVDGNSSVSGSIELGIF